VAPWNDSRLVPRGVAADVEELGCAPPATTSLAAAAAATAAAVSMAVWMAAALFVAAVVVEGRAKTPVKVSAQAQRSPTREAVRHVGAPPMIRRDGEVASPPCEWRKS